MYAPRIRLATLPTPLYRLEKLSELLGEEIWIKRDDLTGFAEGGNKVRKAEYLLADALDTRSDVVITAGAAQSNHARVIAAAASRAGLECRLVLSGPDSEASSGNLLLDRLSGAKLHFVENGAERAPEMERIADSLRAEGRTPYVIPIGGSNVTGAMGYVEGFRELDAQIRGLPPMSTSIWFATSSGGTFGGLLAGRAEAASETGLVGVRVDLDPEGDRDTLAVANGLAERLDIAWRFSPQHLVARAQHVGDGYGIPTEEGVKAMRALWRTEGVLLDPVYTAKAMAGLIAAARAGELAGRRTIFLHTGGGPSVYAAGGAS
jgi:L-cysteate sulfo-lyase